jgi:hypothetical protein
MTDRRMTLKQAAEVFFGDARHAATLRVEIDRGNLVASKIGRAYWTTLPALHEMEAKCRVEAQARASGGTKREIPGPSSTADSTVAQGAAQRKLLKLKSTSGLHREQAQAGRRSGPDPRGCPRSLRRRTHRARRQRQTHPLRHRTFEQMVGNEKGQRHRLCLVPGLYCASECRGISSPRVGVFECRYRSLALEPRSIDGDAKDQAPAQADPRGKIL